jgi:hypothetical protein
MYVIVHMVHAVYLSSNACNHGLINYKDTNAKCRHLQKLTCKGTLRQVSESQNPVPVPPVYTVYLFTVEPERRGREATQESTDPKAGVKIPT